MHGRVAAKASSDANFANNCVKLRVDYTGDQGE
jgi:hypothetical protein